MHAKQGGGRTGTRSGAGTVLMAQNPTNPGSGLGLATPWLFIPEQVPSHLWTPVSWCTMGDSYTCSRGEEDLGVSYLT